MPTPKRAFLSGITGQTGSYLAEYLLQNGYEVWGMIRRSSSFNTGRIDHIYQDPHCPEPRLHLVYGDMLDGSSLARIVNEARPHEVYNLAAQSHVRVSFDQPVYTMDVVALGTLRLLEACRTIKPIPKFVQASSSEMFGNADAPQNETTPFDPQSPYACAKAAAYHLVSNYRSAYGMFACNAISYNHESPRRGETFLTRKVTRAATRISLGLQRYLYLGNLDARRDWGAAQDVVRGMWMMAQHHEPGDFVLATGVTRSVQDFVQLVFEKLGLDWRAHVRPDGRYTRPTEVHCLLGDARKAGEVLGWKPTISFEDLVDGMIEHDLALARKEQMQCRTQNAE